MSDSVAGLLHGPKVDGMAGRRVALQGATPDSAEPSLGYYGHTGTLRVFPHGFSLKPLPRQMGVCPVTGLPVFGGVRLPPSKGGKRGKIEGFSSKAAARLRHFLLTEGAEGLLWDLTLTIPGDISPDEWYKLQRRLFKRWERAGFAIVWRVELQKRKVPHLHCIAWTPSGMPAEARNKLIYQAWWWSLPEEKRWADGAWAHCCHVKGPYTDIEQSPKWLAYIAAHAGKRKKEQLGWKGKQWGIVNRKLFSPRSPMLDVDLSAGQEKLFKRTVSRFLFAKTRDHRKKLRARGIRTRSRQRRLFFPNGCKAMRIMQPEIVRKIVDYVRVPGNAPGSARSLSASGGLSRNDSTPAMYAKRNDIQTEAGAGGVTGSRELEAARPSLPVRG